MNQEIKKQWIEDLRSGNYVQGTGSLQEDGTFCCLGVLCDQYAKEKNVPWVKRDEYRLYSKLGLLQDGVVEAALLPENVKRWAGLEDFNPVIIYSGETSTLASLNDKYILTFLEIANIIEEQL